MNTRVKRLVAFSLSFVVIVFIFSLWFSGTRAAIPKKLTIQGRLDQGGSLADGNYSMVFKIYDQETGGTALYTESHTGSNKVAVNNGFFKTTLGDLTALNLDFNVPYWLGITIESDSEISPRIALNSSSYAMKAGGLALDKNLNIDSGTLYVDIANNRVGVGTESPGQKLEVVGGNVKADRFGAGAGTVGNPGYYFSDDSDTGMYLISTGKIGFATYGNNRVVIDGTGNVGIGTTSPTEKLTITADDTATTSVTTLLGLNHTTSGVAAAGIGSGLTFRAEADDGTLTDLSQITSTFDNASSTSPNTSLHFYTRGGGALAERVTIDESGNVGIGTASPDTILTISNGDVITNKNSIKMGDFVGGRYMIISGRGGWTAGPEIRYFGSNLRMMSNSTDVMTLTTTGNVGIGTTSPGAKLDVAGEVNIAGKYPISGSGTTINYTAPDGTAYSLDTSTCSDDVWCCTDNNGICFLKYASGANSFLQFSLSGSHSIACTFLHNEDDSPRPGFYFATDGGNGCHGKVPCFMLRREGDAGQIIANYAAYYIICL